MKKIKHLLLSAILLMSTLNLFAQTVDSSGAATGTTTTTPATTTTAAAAPAPAEEDEDDKQFYKGIRVGWQNSNFSDSDMDDLSSFYAGIFAVKRIGAGKLLSLYTGLEYYETGAKENDDNKVVLSYISLPLNLRLKLGPFYGFAGVNPSVKIAESIKIAGVDASDSIDPEGWDIGGQVGAGFKLFFLSIEVKYNLGFIEVFEDNKTEHLQAGLCVYF